MQSAPSGLLRISVATDFGVNLLSPILGDFLLENPDITVNMVLNNRYVESVSYTHLDVYKRQSKDTAKVIDGAVHMFMARYGVAASGTGSPVDGGLTQSRYCLLYTSRCV